MLIPNPDPQAENKLPQRHQGTKKQTNRPRVQRFKVLVKSDPFIREHCDLLRQRFNTVGGKTRKNKTI
jgi:hypothetical protein